MAHDWIAASRLWLVLDRQAAQPRSLTEVTEQAIAGGVDAVLCRIKDAPASTVRALSADVRQTCRELDTPFIMSHFPALALELEADAVQLGTADPPIAEVRNSVGAAMAIGYSTHGVGEARQCFLDGADYVFLGPVFPTPAKLKYGAPLGLEAVGDAAQLPGPVVCIGGINPTNLQSVLVAGAVRVAAINALQRVASPQLAARQFRTLIERHTAG